MAKKKPAGNEEGLDAIDVLVATISCGDALLALVRQDVPARKAVRGALRDALEGRSLKAAGKALGVEPAALYHLARELRIPIADG